MKKQFNKTNLTKIS